MNDPVDTWTVRVDADLAQLNQGLATAAAMGRQFSRSLITAFDGVAVQGKSVGNVVQSLALSLSSLTLKAAFQPMTQAVGGALANLLGGGLAPSFGFANGGAFNRAMPIPFAQGGVISSPVSFPLGNGATAIAGERGAEAIMPLARGPDGRLGVKADGARASPSITFNITTPDADSFRRTESQIAAMLARAVGQGQRNL